jgi:rod shape-determining protein MreC
MCSDKACIFGNPIALMSITGHAPPPLFKRGPAPLVRLLFFAALSIALLIADLRFHTLEWVRLAVATAIWPLQRAASLPLEIAGDLGAHFVRLSSLQTENAQMHRQQLDAARLLLRQQYLEDENRRLRALLEMREGQPVSGQLVEIIHAARDPFSRRVIIDKGLRHGIQAGQAVVDEQGVIGQVTRSFPLMAEVSLLTDKQQAIPVQVQRNGLRAVLFGAGGGQMEMRFTAANADVRAGDILVTSGLDGIYLPGLPVAKVDKIAHDDAGAFAHIRCVPLAGVEHNSIVMVLGSRTPLPPGLESVLAPSDVSVKGSRVKGGAQ